MKTASQFPFLHVSGSLPCKDLGVSGSLSCTFPSTPKEGISYIFGGVS